MKGSHSESMKIYFSLLQQRFNCKKETYFLNLFLQERPISKKANILRIV